MIRRPSGSKTLFISRRFARTLVLGLYISFRSFWTFFSVIFLRYGNFVRNSRTFGLSVTACFASSIWVGLASCRSVICSCGVIDEEFSGAG